ncbi:MAG: UxaA family hydrolase, partial [Gemmatimonadota bacterium]
MKRKAILLNERDDVATALTPLTRGEAVNAAAGSRSVDVTLADEIPFGHKFALRDIAEGEEVLKYGLPIGRALGAIRA